MNEVNYPLFYQCSTQAEFNQLNQQAGQLLGMPNEDTEQYAKPIIDKHGNYWFVVNPEVVSLVDVDDCVNFDQIEFEQLNND
jgi:hypothetical protein